MTAGIYIIRNTVNGKVYVGSSRNIENRFRQHRRTLRLGKHHNNHLQRSWKEHGENAFEFKIAERIDDSSTLIIIEQSYMDRLKSVSTESGYNISPCANGRAQPEEVILKCRAKMAGRKPSQLAIQKSVEARRGKATWNKGKTWTPEQREKLMIARASQRGRSPWNRGIPMNDEIKAKVSNSRKGKGLGNKNWAGTVTATDARIIAVRLY